MAQEIYIDTEDDSVSIGETPEVEEAQPAIELVATVGGTELAEWFDRLNVLADAYFVECGLASVPVHISCGRTGKKFIGLCYPKSASADGVNVIYIGHQLEEALSIINTLLHEKCHAVDDCESGHKAPFKRLLKTIGCEGKATQSKMGESLTTLAAEWLAEIGAYPHAVVAEAGKKEAVRNLKIVCHDLGCDVFVRSARGHFDTREMVEHCGEPMMWENERSDWGEK